MIEIIIHIHENYSKGISDKFVESKNTSHVLFSVLILLINNILYPTTSKIAGVYKNSNDSTIPDPNFGIGLLHLNAGVEYFQNFRDLQ